MDCFFNLFSTRFRRKKAGRPLVVRFRIALRLSCAEVTYKIRGRAVPLPIVFKETINGRSYVIEVHPVSRDRWRACLVRRTSTTALMPFYGPTPDEAKAQLTSWLLRASGHQPASTSATTAG